MARNLRRVSIDPPDSLLLGLRRPQFSVSKDTISCANSTWIFCRDCSRQRSRTCSNDCYIGRNRPTPNYVGRKGFQRSNMTFIHFTLSPNCSMESIEFPPSVLSTHCLELTGVIIIRRNRGFNRHASFRGTSRPSEGCPDALDSPCRSPRHASMPDRPSNVRDLQLGDDQQPGSDGRSRDGSRYSDIK